MPSPRRSLPLLTELPPAPSSPQQGTPQRPPRSVRRTSHLNVTWPDGPGSDMNIDAAARDLVTPAAGQPLSTGGARLHVTVDRGRVLQTLTSTPHRAELAELVGQGGGSGYRARLQALVPAEMTAGSLLYFLLDDMPGVTLVGQFAWRMWPGAWEEMMQQRPRHRPPHGLVDICSGFRSDGIPIHRMLNAEDSQQNVVPANDLAQPDDPLAWHAIPSAPEGSAMMRRRRRVDVVAGEQLTIDSVFRDSVWSPDGAEMVVHEYGLRATADPQTLRLTGIRADARVLPFATCPAAGRNVDLLLGEPMGALRHRVLELVVGTDGCTHLNDALRALAEVPVLVGELASAETGGRRAGSP